MKPEANNNGHIHVAVSAPPDLIRTIVFNRRLTRGILSLFLLVTWQISTPARGMTAINWASLLSRGPGLTLPSEKGCAQCDLGDEGDQAASANDRAVKSSRIALDLQSFPSNAGANRVPFVSLFSLGLPAFVIPFPSFYEQLCKRAPPVSV